MNTRILERLAIVEPSMRTNLGAIHSRQLRIVCTKHCNAGWMKRVEDQAAIYFEPMIRGEAVKLDRCAQRILSAWIFELFIVAEHTDKQNIAISSSNYTHLMEKLEPPPNCAIYIGHYVGTDQWSGIKYRHHGISYQTSKQRDVSASIYKTHVSAQTIGRLFFHCFGSDGPMFENFVKDLYNSTVYRIWPPSDQVICWPSGNMIDDSLANDLADAILNASLRNS